MKKNKYTKKQIEESIKHWQKKLDDMNESAIASRGIDFGAKIDLQSSLFFYTNLPPEFNLQVSYNVESKESSLVVVDNDEINQAEYSYYTIDKMRSRSDVSIEITTKREFSVDDWHMLSSTVEKALRKMFGPGFSLHLDEPFMVPYRDKIGRTWYIAFLNFIG